MRYFKVTARRGHCGNNRYLPITFGIMAPNMIAAMDMAKQMPGVKHSSSILGAAEISYSEYRHLVSTNAYKRVEGGLCDE